MQLNRIGGGVLHVPSATLLGERPIIRKGEVTLSGSVRLSVAFAIPSTHPMVNWASDVEADTSQPDHSMKF